MLLYDVFGTFRSAVFLMVSEKVECKLGLEGLKRIIAKANQNGMRREVCINIQQAMKSFLCAHLGVWITVHPHVFFALCKKKKSSLTRRKFFSGEVQFVGVCSNEP